MNAFTDITFDRALREADAVNPPAPDRASLASVLSRVLDAGTPLDGAADHGVSEAVYFRDPDGNGIELYVDRAPEDWPRSADGTLAMVNAPLDVAALLGEAAPA